MSTDTHMDLTLLNQHVGWHALDLGLKQGPLGLVWMVHSFSLLDSRFFSMADSSLFVCHYFGGLISLLLLYIDILLTEVNLFWIPLQLLCSWFQSITDGICKPISSPTERFKYENCDVATIRMNRWDPYEIIFFYI